MCAEEGESISTTCCDLLGVFAETVLLKRATNDEGWGK